MPDERVLRGGGILENKSDGGKSEVLREKRGVRSRKNLEKKRARLQEREGRGFLPRCTDNTRNPNI